MPPSLAIGILTCNRLSFLNDTLRTLSTFNPNMSRLILVDNDSTKTIQKENRNIARRYGMRYVLNKPSSAYDKNERIEKGVRKLIKEVLKEHTDLCCLLQDDWRCMGRIPVDAAWHFLNSNRSIGQIRMRDFRYDDTFDGGSSVNFVTRRKIVFTHGVAVGNVAFEIGELHWVDSCNLMLHDVLASISRPFTSETDRMIAFHEKHPFNAQLCPGIFHHTGPRRIRQDLREKGLFVHANIS